MCPDTHRPAPTRRLPRRDRLVEGVSHDPYRNEPKPADPSVCSECGATWREGRWTWRAGPADAPRIRCPACRRTADRYPAGFLRIGGAFAREHREELEHLARHVEQRERREHPMERILEVREDGDELLVTTTEIHLPRAIGSALHAAYEGELSVDYEEDIVRVAWSR